MKNRQKSYWQIPIYGVSVLLIVATIIITLIYLPAYFQAEVNFASEFYKQHLIQLDPHIYGFITVGRDVLVILSFWLVAGTLAWRNWRNPFTAFLAILLVMAGVTFPNILLVEIDDQRLVFLGGFIRYISQITFVAFLFLFPNGKFYPRWLRFPVILWPFLLILPTFYSFIAPEILPQTQWKEIRSFLEVTFMAAGLISQILRYRNYSQEVERQQTRWVIFGFALVLFSAIVINLGHFLLRRALPEAQAFLIYDFGLITIFGMPAAGIFPILIGISITRYRLWDLQSILSRITVYFFVTGILFIFGVLCIYVVQYILLEILGRSSGAELIVAVLLVVIFAGPIYTFSRRKLTGWVYPNTIQHNQEIEQFSNEVRVLFESAEIAKLLHKRIAAVVDIQYCQVYQYESQDEYILIYPTGRDDTPSEIGYSIFPEDFHTNGVWFPTTKTDRLYLKLANDQIPGETTWMGIAEIGPKVSGRGFTGDEIHFIKSMGQEAGLALYVSHVQTQITLLAAALESAANSIALVNANGYILWVNPAFISLTGYTPEEMTGESYMKLSDVLKNEGGAAWEIVSDKKTWIGAGVSHRKDGSQYFEELSMTPVLHEKGEISHLVVIKNDISERVKIQEKLEHLATHDPLTNLPNRNLFSDRLSHALTATARTGQRGAVLYLDLDDFKAINDVYTHELGDLLLIKLAERMAYTIRARDTIARIGGDEFAILLEEIDSPTDAGMFGDRLIQVIEKPIKLNDINVQIAGSIGVSIFPEDGTETSTLMRNADIAMYRAKHSGKGQVAYFTEAMSREVEHNLEIRNILRTAVPDGCLKLVFQPQIDIRTNRQRGIEALLRLEHPVDGTLTPDSFLDLAEKSGAVVEIEDWVLNQSLKVGNQIIERLNQPIKIAVNISASQLFSDGFVKRLSTILSNRGFPPKHLELELTESSIMQNIDRAREILLEIKALGVYLAIDDFGTGYSSLNYLAMLPFDVLKIARGFVTVLENNREHEAVFDGILTIARNLEIDIIVEGIETDRQLAYFTKRGISLIQGFYFSKPLTETDLLGTYLQPDKA